MSWWDERSVDAPSAAPAAAAPCCVHDLPEALLSLIFSPLAAACPRDAAAAAAACRSFRSALAPLAGREWACAACGRAAFTHAALLPQRPERWAYLLDGPGLSIDTASSACFLVRDPTRRVSEAEALHAGPYPTRGGGGAGVGGPRPLHRCTPLLCPGCGLYLGAAASGDGCAAHERCAAGAWAAVAGAYVVRRLLGGAPDPALAPAAPPMLLRCAAATAAAAARPAGGGGGEGGGGGRCGHPLAAAAAVLSRAHAWALPGAGRVEPALYLNSALPPPPPPPPPARAGGGGAAGGGAPAAAAEGIQGLGREEVRRRPHPPLALSPFLRAELAQGPFEVAHAACGRCGAAVGWAFGRYLRRGITGRGAWGRLLPSPPPPLAHPNEGRVGIVASAVYEAA